jgi:segregation and condensation protein A
MPFLEAKKGYKIKLENYFGPLDLLLYLVREKELDITRVSISKVAEQYITYIEMLNEHKIDMASEFLITASHLMYIKTRELLPSVETPQEEEDFTLELIKKLVEYKKYKDRAGELKRLYEERVKIFGRPQQKILDKEITGEETVEVELWDLLIAYAKLTKQITLDIPMSIPYADIPMETFITKIMEIVTAKGRVAFSEFVNKDDKYDVVANFLAVLELTKRGDISVTQSLLDNDIIIEHKVA